METEREEAPNNTRLTNVSNDESCPTLRIDLDDIKAPLRTKVLAAKRQETARKTSYKEISALKKQVVASKATVLRKKTLNTSYVT